MTPEKILDFGIQLASILFAISFHESAHAWMALKWGDSTAKDLGRISLNPLRHIDPFGSILLPILLYVTSGGRFLFAYAKPTPVRLENTRDPNRADRWISGAGPLSNFLLAGIGLLVLVGIKLLSPRSMDDLFAALRGDAFAGGALTPIAVVLFAFVRVNLMLGLFNLIPIPPLDGSWVLSSIFGAPVRRLFESMAPFGFMILILMSWVGLLGRIMYPPLRFFEGIVLRVLFS